MVGLGKRSNSTGELSNWLNNCSTTDGLLWFIGWIDCCTEGQESPVVLPCSLLSALPSPVVLFCTGFRSATPSPLSTTTELGGGAARLAAEEEEAEGPCLEMPPAAPPTPP